MSNKALSNVNFLSPIGFKFSCDFIPNVEFFCRTANIPGVSINSVEVSTPLSPHYVPGDAVQYEELNVTILVDEYMTNWLEIYNWIIGLGHPQSLDQYRQQKLKGIKAQGVLSVLTSSSTPQLEFHFEDMFPVSISGVEFDVSNSDVTYVTADITFRYNKYTIKNLKNS